MYGSGYNIRFQICHVVIISLVTLARQRYRNSETTAIDIQRGSIVANRSNHRSRRSIASAGPRLPLRVPGAATALALVLALSGAPAHGQSQPAAAQKNTTGNAQPPDAPAAKPKGKPEVLQEVVVTGLRQSLMSAEAIKRLAPQIVDSVTPRTSARCPTAASRRPWSASPAS